MSIIGAKGSDWRSGNPDLYPWHWVAAFIGAALIYFIVLETAGTVING